MRFQFCSHKILFAVALTLTLAACKSSEPPVQHQHQDQAQPQAQPTSQPEAQTKAQPETPPLSQPEPQAKAQAEKHPLSQPVPKAQPQVQVEPQAQVQPQPQAQPKPQPQPQPQAQPQAPSSQYDFNVAVATKDQTHPHNNEGSKIGFVINGVQGRSLVLVRGKTYTFRVDTNPMHDFYLATDAQGWGTAALTEGVKGNYTFRGVVTFKPDDKTPDVVYYACRNHQFMGGEIHVVNPGEEGKIRAAEPSAAAPAMQKNHPAVDKNEVNQRLNFANMFIGNSEAAKRITASSNAEAKAKYQDAQNKLSAASSAFDSGNLQDAKAKVDEAMGLMNEAAKLVPSESAQKRAKARNDELLQGVMDMEASYKQNRDEIGSKGTKLDTDKIHKQVDTAKALAAEGKYDESNKILSGITNEISGLLNKMLANTTMSYEMKFSSQAKEYEYELERFSSHEKLIPQAVEQKQPAPEMLSLVQGVVNRAKEKRDLANADAKDKNFAAALENIKAATDQLNNALKLLGVN